MPDPKGCRLSGLSESRPGWGRGGGIWRPFTRVGTGNSSLEEHGRPVCHDPHLPRVGAQVPRGRRHPTARHPTISPGHIWLPLPEPQPPFAPAPEPPPPPAREGCACAARPPELGDVGSAVAGRALPGPHHPPSAHSPTPAPLTHGRRGEGVRRLSRGRSCRSRRVTVRHSCRGAGSCQRTRVPSQVKERRNTVGAATARSTEP